MKERKALSEVVSTLILLVVAVLLASVATYYATNITMTRTETEEIQFSKEHIWVNSTGAVAAFKVSNLGGRDILLDKISVRGVAEEWTDVFVYRVPSGTSISADLTVCNYTDMSGGFTHESRIYTTVSDDIPLVSGGELLVYVKDPDNVQIDDIGTTISIAIHTNNAQYISECNVESATTQ
jgi:flagellin-like protein